MGSDWVAYELRCDNVLKLSPVARTTIVGILGYETSGNERLEKLLNRCKWVSGMGPGSPDFLGVWVKMTPVSWPPFLVIAVYLENSMECWV
jgi:hypothetical protein